MSWSLLSEASSGYTKTMRWLLARTAPDMGVTLPKRGFQVANSPLAVSFCSTFQRLTYMALVGTTPQYTALLEVDKVLRCCFM